MTKKLNANREIIQTQLHILGIYGMYVEDLQIPKMEKIYSRTNCRIPITMFLIKLVLFNDPRD